MYSPTVIGVKRHQIRPKVDVGKPRPEVLPIACLNEMFQGAIMSGVTSLHHDSNRSAWLQFGIDKSFLLRYGRGIWKSGMAAV